MKCCPVFLLWSFLRGVLLRLSFIVQHCLFDATHLIQANVLMVCWTLLHLWPLTISPLQKHSVPYVVQEKKDVERYITAGTFLCLYVYI